MASRSQTVLVSGSGPSGLAAALVLAQSGVSVRVIEKDAQFKVGQRATGVMPRTLELHKFLSTFENIWDQSMDIPMMRVHDLEDGTKVVKEFALSTPDKPTPAIPYPEPRILGQEAHEALLRQALAKHGVQVELGTELVSFIQDADKVDVVLRHSADNTEEVSTFQWLIGADGARSVVRKTLGLNFLGNEQFEHYTIVGDIHVKSGISRKYWNMWGTRPKKFVALYPSEHVSGENADRYTFYYANFDLPESQLPTNREELLEAFGAIMKRSDVEYGDMIWMSKWIPNIRMVNTFGVNKVFLVGDAAHCHSPTGGQGLNSSVQDAVNLAWKLSLVTKGVSSSQLLDSYTQERLPVIATMLNKTTTLLKTILSSSGSQQSFQRGAEFKMLGVNYRGSPIVAGGREQKETQVLDPYRNSEDGKLASGDRAPNASVGLFDIFKVTHHTIIVFESSRLAEEVVAVTEGWKAPVRILLVLPAGRQEQKPVGVDRVLQDEDGSAFANYQVQGQGVTIVRPDGIIGAISGSADCVKQYADLVFN